jgi:hypothetical protein
VKPLLIDADAFLCVRKLNLLPAMCAARPGGKPVTIGEYVARRELSGLASELKELERVGSVVVVAIERRGPSGARFKNLKNAGMDAGEAEALAWALDLPPAERPMFVSLDVAARGAAVRHGVVSGDVMDLVVELVEAGIVVRADAEAALVVWEDRRNQFGRPPDFTTFDATYQARLRRRRASP